VSCRLRLLYAASTVTVGALSFKSNDAFVRLRSSFDRNPLSTASLYRSARSDPLMLFRAGPAAVVFSRFRSASTVRARRSRRRSSFTFNGSS